MGLAQLVMVADNSQRNAPLEATPTGALFGDLEARERDATPRTPWSPPDEIDGYRLLRPIGRGGMGRVYLGFEGALARNVALKFLSPEILREPEAHERFRVEARAIARAQHPNVVTIYRVGEQRGLPYIAYEFVRGRTLDALESMSWQRLLTLAIGCARGLAAAHRRGVLHRDIKPSNIVVCDETGEPKLIDFGIAKLAELGADAEPRVEADAREQQEAPRRSLAHPSASGVYAATLSMRVTATTPTSFAPDPAPDSTRTLTRFGTLLGTPYYLAPERWRGEEATARADIYALG
ncbi:MAG: serine/threonine protein kinase, partial [Myxococcales bacterium]|nr:serine/threonine protein kinase [Myxococcales bacterium]